jgi:uncharacterized membrane protein YesL
MGKVVETLPSPVQVIAFALNDWWDDWVNMLIINLALWLCWLTVVLGPPATFGIVYVTNQLAHGSSLGPGGLLTGMRLYFFRSWAWMLINLFVALIISVNIYFYRQQETGWATLLGSLFIVLALFWMMLQFYALPYLMEQSDKSVWIAFRNALFTILAAPGYTLIVAGFAGLLVALSIGVIAPLFLGAPCLVACLGNRAIIERIDTFGVRQREQIRDAGSEDNMED